MDISWTGTRILFRGRRILSRPSVSWVRRSGKGHNRRSHDQVDQPYTDLYRLLDTFHCNGQKAQTPDFFSGIRNRLKATVIRRIMNRGFNPFTINFTGTLERRMMPPRKQVARTYPQKESRHKQRDQEQKSSDKFHSGVPVGAEKNLLDNIVLS